MGSSFNHHGILNGLGEILNILGACPWVGSCTCGWSGTEWPSEADATSEAWAHSESQHG